MRFNIHAPIDLIDPLGEFQTLDAVREISRAIEASGAAGAYVTEHPAPDAHWLHNDPTGHDTLDPFTSLAFVAAATTTLKVITNVVVVPYRNPFITAKAAATLQILSGGRFIFGAGTGYQLGEFEALGVPFNKRGALMDEALETIRMAWAGGAVVKKGMGFEAKGNEPRPVPNPAPPIWIGGGSIKAVERAARWGDGWAPFFALPTNDPHVEASSVTSIAQLREKMAHCQELRATLGKTGPFDLSIGVPVKLKPKDNATAREYGDKVQELAAAGVTWATVILPGKTRAQFLDHLAWFGEEVIAKDRRG